MYFHLRTSLLPILLVSFASCAIPTGVSCGSFGDPSLDEDEVAVLHFATASLEAIDGIAVPLGRDPEISFCNDARLHPGQHTLTLRAEVPVSELDDPSGYLELKHDLSFRAEPGHSYELHFNLNEDRNLGVLWWIEDALGNEIVATGPQ